MCDAPEEYRIVFKVEDIDQLYPDFHPIHSAVRSSKSEVVDYLLKLKPACINFTDYNGLTPLHHAVLYLSITC